MADEKKAVKAAEPGKAGKVLNWFKTLPARIAKPFKNMVTELRRVTWPSKRKLIIYSIVVLVFMVVMGLIVGLFDLGAVTLVHAIKPA